MLVGKFAVLMDTEYERTPGDVCITVDWEQLWPVPVDEWDWAAILAPDWERIQPGSQIGMSSETIWLTGRVTSVWWLDERTMSLEVDGSLDDLDPISQRSTCWLIGPALCVLRDTNGGGDQ